MRVWDSTAALPLLAFRGHEDAVTDAIFSGDDRFIASSSIDGTLRLWETSAPVFTLIEPGQEVPGVAFLDDSTLVSGHSDEVVRVWSLKSGRVAQQVAVPGEISDLSIAGRSHRIAVGLVNRASRTRGPLGVLARVIDGDTLVPIATLRGAVGTIQSIAASVDGRSVATVSDSEHAVRLWDVASQREVHQWNVNAAPAALDPDGRHPGASSKWDVNAAPAALAFAPDGSRLAAAVPTSVSESTIVVWSINSDNSHGSHPALTIDTHAPVRAITFTTDGTRLVSGCADGRLQIWDAQSGQRLAERPGHDAAIAAVTVSPDGRRIASAGADKTVRIWNTDSYELLLTLRLFSAVRSLAFNAAGDRLAAGRSGGMIQLWYSR